MRSASSGCHSSSTSGSATLKLSDDAFNKSVIQHIKLWVDDAAGDVADVKDLRAANKYGEPDAGRFPNRSVQKPCSARLKMFQQTSAQPSFKNAS